MENEIIRIYLDLCCLNRPFDDQSQLRIQLEAEAKLRIQEEIRLKNVHLIWSYVLDFENSRNPFVERRRLISKWKEYAEIDVDENPEIINAASTLSLKGLRKIDSLHIACAVFSKCRYFITTDDKILNKAMAIQEVGILDPFAYIKEISL